MCRCRAGATAAPATSDAATPVVTGFWAAAVPTGFCGEAPSDGGAEFCAGAAVSGEDAGGVAFCPDATGSGLSGSSGGGTESCAAAVSKPNTTTNEIRSRYFRELQFVILIALNSKLIEIDCNRP